MKTIPSAPSEAAILARLEDHVTKGDAAEAKQAFTQIVDQHPDSPYVQEARTGLESLSAAS